jgi:drug/metabolite transporter (DMT)-like permease
MPSTAEAIGLVYLGTVVSAGAFFLWYDALPQLGTDRARLLAGVLSVKARDHCPARTWRPRRVAA